MLLDFRFIDLTFYIGQLLLNELAGVANPLVVDRRPEMRQKEIEQTLRPKSAEVFVELVHEMTTEHVDQTLPTLVVQIDTERLIHSDCR